MRNKTQNQIQARTTVPCQKISNLYNSSNHSFLDWLKSFSKHRLIWGTCAGLIVLSDQLVAKGTKTGGQEILGGLPVRTTSNQWGCQTESFEQLTEIPFIKNPEIPFAIIAQLPSDSLLSRSCTTHQQSLGPDSHVVAVKFQHLFATSFWPELSPGT
ncbi:hypothetical protein KEM48_005506 [Puccinia striiformis f. sp. tritici PST-130]|nr:hypothetical protein KEM48_005506 [Puccinia striiformis f. sp. tritici PST-130]